MLLFPSLQMLLPDHMNCRWDCSFSVKSRGQNSGPEYVQAFKPYMSEKGIEILLNDLFKDFEAELNSEIWIKIESSIKR
jgi:hypothetical protein